MMTVMSDALGYDEWGNNPELLCEADKVKLEEGEWQRVGGDAVCDCCGLPWRAHPEVQGARWLRRGCRVLVKL